MGKREMVRIFKSVGFLGLRELCLQKNPVFSLAEKGKKMQRLGLCLNLIGTILFRLGALGKPGAT